jgi:hypothetical protein
MTNRTIWFSLLSAGAVLLFSLAGCSDDDIIGSYESPTVNPSSTTFYFSIDPGYTSTFEVRESDGRSSLLTLKVGRQVPFLGTSAVEWFHQVESGFDTSFVVISGASIYLYETKGSIPERILQGPIAQGAQWTRYPTADSQGDTTTITTGETDLGDIVDKGNADTGDGGALKFFPTTGSNELRVERIETIVLSTGSSFSGCAKVVNQLSDDSMNQYWFAPGYGLVKYVIGATQGYPAGRQIGEMVSFIK